MHWERLRYLPDGDDILVAVICLTNKGMRKISIQDDIVYANELSINYNQSHDNLVWVFLLC